MTSAIARRTFSWGWVGASIAIFIVAELVIGGLVGQFVTGYQSMALGFTLQGLLHIVAFLVGGFIVGLVSPSERMIEPAVGAFLSMALMWLIAQMTPYRWFQFGLRNVLIGGGAAFVVALIGAYAGERLTGRV